MNPPTEWTARTLDDGTVIVSAREYVGTSTGRYYWSELTVGVEPWRIQADGPAVALTKAIRHAIRELLRFRAPLN
jgi:hypothetical protein